MLTTRIPIQELTTMKPGAMTILKWATHLNQPSPLLIANDFRVTKQRSNNFMIVSPLPLNIEEGRVEILRTAYVLREVTLIGKIGGQ